MHGKLYLFLWWMLLCLVGVSGLEVKAVDWVYGAMMKVTVHGTGQFNNVAVLEQPYDQYFGTFNQLQTCAGELVFTWTGDLVVGRTLTGVVGMNSTTLATSQPQTIVAGLKLYEFHLYIYGATPAQAYKFEDCYTNKKNYPVTMVYKSAGDPALNGVVAQVGQMTIAPGETKCVTLGPFTGKWPIYVEMQYPTGEKEAMPPILADNPAWSNDGGESSGQDGTLEGKTGYKDSVTNINFPTDTTDLAKDSTLQMGFQQLKQGLIDNMDFTAQGILMQSQDNALIAGKLDAVSAAVNNQGAGLSAGVASLNTAAGVANTHLSGVNDKLGQVVAANSAVATLLQQDYVVQQANGEKLGTIQQSGASIASSALAANQYLSDIKASAGRQEALLGNISSAQSTLNSIYSGISAGNASLGSIAGGMETINNGVTYSRAALQSIDGKLSPMASDISAIKAYDERTAQASESALDYQRRTATAAEAMQTDLHKIEQATQVPWTKEQYEAYSAIFVEEAVTKGQQAGNAMKAPWDAAAASWSAPADVAADVGSMFQLSMGGWHIDLDPAHSPIMVQMAGFVKRLLEWLITVLYLLACLKSAEGYIRQVGGINQAMTPNVSVAGTNIFNRSIGFPVALAILAVIAIVPTLCINIIGGSMPVLSQNPLTGSPSGIIHLCNMFLPVSFFLWHLGSWVVFRLTLAGNWLMVTSIVRMLIGG